MKIYYLSNKINSVILEKFYDLKCAYILLHLMWL